MPKFNFEGKWLWSIFQYLDVRYTIKCHQKRILVDYCLSRKRKVSPFWRIQNFHSKIKLGSHRNSSHVFYIFVTYQFGVAARGPKACQLGSARAPQATCTMFYGEDVQKQIYTQKPCDFHVLHLYHCFLLRIKVFTLHIGRVEYTLSAPQSEILHPSLKFCILTLPTPPGPNKLLGAWVWINSTSSPGSWEISGVSPKLVLDMGTWVLMTDPAPYFIASWMLSEISTNPVSLW